MAASSTTSRFELAADVRLSPVSADAVKSLGALLGTFSVTRLGHLRPQAEGYSGHAVAGVLVHQSRLSLRRFAWTLVELRASAGAAEACVCAIVPSDLATSAGATVGEVICLLSPSISISQSRAALVLRVRKPEQIRVIGYARDYGTCTVCGTAINLSSGAACALHQAAVRIKCDRLDVASQAPRLHIVGLPVKQRRPLSTGVYRLDDAQLVVDQHGRAILVPHAANDSTEKATPSLQEAQHHLLVPKKSIGARYLSLAKQAAEDNQARAAATLASSAPPPPHVLARPTSRKRPMDGSVSTL